MKAFPFDIGAYRPIYLWGGPGTIRMNRLKFMDTPVDEPAHHAAHLPHGAELVVRHMRCNWVHLMYDWGFPPEVEQEDWESFRRAAEVYHEAGTPVFAYIQTSNCVYAGSFRQKDWYALDAKGKKFHYYTGRYMACLNHPEWRQHLKDLIRGALERGADGLFFDNPWQGTQPGSLLGAWLGGAGCYCANCQQLYRADTGESIPATISPDQPPVARYLRWRADQLTALMAELAGYTKSLKPDAPVSANDYDAVMRNSYLVYGIDLAALARVQDVAMIENFALPKWDVHPKLRLANNALTIHTARALIGEAAPLSVLSYDVGIGFDPVYPPRRYQQGIAEAAACGASMTTKGTEYNDGKHLTVLTDRKYASVHAAIGRYHTWLEAKVHLYTKRRNVAPVAVLHPGGALWQQWHTLAPLYFGAGQTLTAGGLPWRVLGPGQLADDVDVLLTFDDESAQSYARPGLQVIYISSLAGWRKLRPSPVARHAALRQIVTGGAQALLKAYHESKLARGVMDRLGLPRLITQSPCFYLPSPEARASLLAALPVIYPRVSAPAPALIEVWQGEQGRQIHLVNYAAAPQNVQVHLGDTCAGSIVSPDDDQALAWQGDRVDLALDVYKLLLLKTP